MKTHRRNLTERLAQQVARNQELNDQNDRQKELITKLTLDVELEKKKERAHAERRSLDSHSSSARCKAIDRN